MPTETFTDYDTLADALGRFQIAERLQRFVQPLPYKSDPSLRDSVEIARLHYLGPSENALCEGLIFPVLLAAWREHLETLQLFNRPRLSTPDLRGNPEYVLSRRSDLGPRVFGPPHLMIIEAKQERWLEGWGQCLAAMVAAREVNKSPDQIVYGIVTTGNDWEFGKLEGKVFLHDPQQFVISDLDRLIGAVKFVFEECKRLALATPRP